MICEAEGGSPATILAFNATLAASPPPPATGISNHSPPLAAKSSFNTLRAAASPPEVHQCNTSIFGPAIEEVEVNANVIKAIIIFFMSFLFFIKLTFF